MKKCLVVQRLVFFAFPSRLSLCVGLWFQECRLQHVKFMWSLSL